MYKAFSEIYTTSHSIQLAILLKMISINGSNFFISQWLKTSKIKDKNITSLAASANGQYFRIPLSKGKDNDLSLSTYSIEHLKSLPEKDGKL